MSRLSMDFKVMPRSHKGHRYILCIIDEVTNFLITVPIFQARSEEIGEALLENFITKYCIPEYIIMDQDSAFMSLLMTYLFHRLDIKIKTIAPYNHQSLQGSMESNPLHGFLPSTLPVWDKCEQNICHYQHLHITLLTVQI